ncbi:MAG: hypothetical protein E7200_00785 [Selenomonas ruminantium]|nr:hypothetical protein [Selenomonas ruminantium]
MDLPAAWVEQVQKIDWAQLKEKVQDYGPALKVVKGTWSRESLKEISEGRLFVPDEVINDALAKGLEKKPQQGLKRISLRSHENGKLDIEASTQKGELKLSGKIKEFVHQGDKTYMVYQVQKKRLPGHGLMSWIFSLVSLSMVERMMGKVDTFENMPVDIKHNDVRVDCSQVLAASTFGQTSFHGHRLLDMIEIKGAIPKENGIEFQTELHIPDDVKADLKGLLKSKGEEIRTENGGE